MDNREIPYSEIDLQMQLTDPKWGRDVPLELKQKLTKMMGYYKDNTGEIKTIQEGLWGLLSFYTRDIRLANLSPLFGELGYCRYYLDLAGDLLKEGYINSFLVALARVVTVLELSQYKGGFLRKIFSTVRQHHIREELEPKKRNLFGGNKSEV